MNPRARGLVLAAVQLAIVLSLGGKLLWDRAHLPRVWVRATPFDPDLPLRGRYVQLRALIDAADIEGTPPDAPSVTGSAFPEGAIRLEVRGDRLVAVVLPKAGSLPHPGLFLQKIRGGSEATYGLNREIAYFLPEHAQDPSRRPAGEQLWVEATIPPSGPPRPIRLGVKVGGGAIVPLDLD
jgi:hypothetical protein